MKQLVWPLAHNIHKQTSRHFGKQHPPIHPPIHPRTSIRVHHQPGDFSHGPLRLDPAPQDQVGEHAEAAAADGRGGVTQRLIHRPGVVGCGLGWGWVGFRV